MLLLKLGFVLSDQVLMRLLTKTGQGLVHRVIDWAEQKEIGGSIMPNYDAIIVGTGQCAAIGGCRPEGRDHRA
jgi:hypothetical protein